LTDHAIFATQRCYQLQPGNDDVWQKKMLINVNGKDKKREAVGSKNSPFTIQCRLPKKISRKEKRGKGAELISYLICVLFYSFASLSGINKALSKRY